VTTLFVLPLIAWVLHTNWLSQSEKMAELKPLVDSRVK
jgi:hypothetical protein